MHNSCSLFHTCTLGSPWYLHAIFIWSSSDELGVWLGVEDDTAAVEGDAADGGGGGGKRVLCVSSTQPGRSYNYQKNIQCSSSN